MINNFDICLESIDKKHFFIKDGDEQKPAFILKENGEFEVVNSTKNSINFLKTDSYIYTSKAPKRCDCILYNNDTICFIELKLTKRTQWKSWRKSANKQLETTILNFKNEEIAKNKTLEAYMCCTYCDINDKITKISRATNKIETITYFEDTLNTALYCATKKEFN